MPSDGRTEAVGRETRCCRRVGWCEEVLLYQKMSLRRLQRMCNERKNRSRDSLVEVPAARGSTGSFLSLHLSAQLGWVAAMTSIYSTRSPSARAAGRPSIAEQAPLDCLPSSYGRVGHQREYREPTRAVHGLKDASRASARRKARRNGNWTIRLHQCVRSSSLVRRAPS